MAYWEEAPLARCMEEMTILSFVGFFTENIFVIEPSVEKTVSNNIDSVESMSFTDGSLLICVSFLQEKIRNEKIIKNKRKEI